MLLQMVLALALGAMVEGDRGGEVRVVPVEATPEPDSVDIKIVFPREGEVKQEGRIKTQFRIEGFPLGIYSDFPRARELRDRGEGQTLHILVDGKPFVEVNEALEDSSDTEEIDFDQTIEISLPYTLGPGLHVIRAFLLRSFDEALTGRGAFAATTFYIKEKKETIDLSRPYLTYNQPEGSFSGDEPILLDFLIANTQLSKDGYKVRLTIDGSDKRILTEQGPYYIYGLKKGTHNIRLELLDPSGKVLPPLFNDTEKNIRVN